MSTQIRWLVDGFNVLHTALLHGRKRGAWWKEDARRQLLERVRGFDEAPLWIVFDGSLPAEDAAKPSTAKDSENFPHVVFAPSADAWLLRKVRSAEVPEKLVIVTADRQLADRARHQGAKIVSPRAFLARCPLLTP